MYQISKHSKALIELLEVMKIESTRKKNHCEVKINKTKKQCNKIARTNKFSPL